MLLFDLIVIQLMFFSVSPKAFQIANLIREYTEVLQSPHEVRKREGKKKSNAGNARPVSILHKPAPVIEQQPQPS